MYRDIEKMPCIQNIAFLTNILAYVRFQNPGNGNRLVEPGHRMSILDLGNTAHGNGRSERRSALAK